MARTIDVYQREDLKFVQTPPTSDVWSKEYEEWEKEALSRSLFGADLGSEGNVREYWSAPACGLGLELLSSVYGKGFDEGIRWSGSSLSTLKHELLILEEEWGRMELTPAARSDLLERLQALRQAIDVAIANDAVVSIA